MIRVLHVVTTMDAGGIETMLMNIYRNINREIIQFDFLVHREYEGYYEDEILSLGGRIHRVPKIGFTNINQYIKELKRFFVSHPEYSIVHSHISINSYLVLRVCKLCGVQVKIAHSHEAHKSINEHKLIRRPIIIFSKLFINKYVDYRFACSQEAGRWLFGVKESFRIINNAIDSKNYIFSAEKRDLMRTELNLENSFTIGHIGNFSKAKNYPFILDVFNEIYKQNKSAKLVLIGKNENNPEVEKRVKELNLDENVIFTGVRSDIPDLLQAIDVFLFPSLHEGLPVTLIEAQASGLKVLASDTITNEVEITDNIEFFSLDEPAKEWASRILKYSYGYERKDTSREIITAGYEVKQSAKELEDFYIKNHEIIQKNII